MKNAIGDAIRIARKTGEIYIATSGEFPHIATARKVSAEENGRISVSEFFCPATIENLDKNRKIAMSAYDDETNTGYQLLGEVEEIHDTAMLDGYGGEDLPAVPQTERELKIRVRHVLNFNSGPHTDKELEQPAPGGTREEEMKIKTDAGKQTSWACAHCGYTADGRFKGDICPQCGLAYWKCSNCGFTITAGTPPGVCPQCDVKCSFLNITCYTPECGGPGRIDQRL